MTTAGRPTAVAFLHAFLNAYSRCRSTCSEAQWAQIWDADWNRFMLWNSPPSGIERTLMQRVSDDLDLEYCEGEPFAIDVVLAPRNTPRWQRFPVPIAVALEHELAYRGFAQEIAKLLTIHCPLKIGITYCDGHLDLIRQWITRAHGLTQSYFREAPDTQYLFIVGVTDRQPKVQHWKALHFTSGCEIPDFTDCTGDNGA